LYVPRCIGLAEYQPKCAQSIQVGRRRPKRHLVEYIEEFGSELHIHAFFDVGTLDDREVLVVNGKDPTTGLCGAGGPKCVGIRLPTKFCVWSWPAMCFSIPRFAVSSAPPLKAA